MNDKERKVFWNTLCSLKGTDLKEDTDLLNKAIIYPKYIYRFRTVNEKTLNALRENKLHFSTSNYYDDPFDTFININFKEIQLVLDNVTQTRHIDKIVSCSEYMLSEWLGIQINNEQRKRLFETLSKNFENPYFMMEIKEYWRNIRNEIKKETWSVCFSEDGLNESLWLKYADQHKGFTVSYDLENKEYIRCGKQEKCVNCRMHMAGMSLYPIYYSDEKYDATNFAYFLSICKMSGNNLNEELFKNITTDMGNQMWEREKITLIKKTCHKYDKEWRMIAPPIYKEGPIIREWVPDAVILGLSMTKSDEAQVIGSAYQAGIRKIYKCYINDKGDLDASLIPLFDSSVENVSDSK